jgi:PAS domain S-box-containing protein
LAQAYNVSLDEYAGKHCYELFYGRNDICEGCPAIKVFNDGKVTRGALRYQPDGRIIDRTAYPFIEDNGDITGIIVIGVDITEQKQSEEKLRESEKKYRNLLETTSQGYWMVNPELKNIEVNQSICKMLGYRPDEMLGKTPFDFADDENRKIFIDQLSKISVTPHRSYEITLKKKDGQDLNTYINGTTIRDESDEVQGAVALITDITDMKQTERRLKQREKQLEIKNIRLEEMNAALKILLEIRDEDKKEIEEKVMTNIKELVLPYVTKLKNTGLNHRQEIFADIIQSNIEEIISPFAQKLSHKYLNFTPTELKVAYLVKQGLRTKEIAKLLGSSPETITRHRKSMRKKLKLTDKKSNLRTHLLSLANGYIE